MTGSNFLAHCPESHKETHTSCPGRKHSFLVSGVGTLEILLVIEHLGVESVGLHTLLHGLLKHNKDLVDRGVVLDSLRSSVVSTVNPGFKAMALMKPTTALLISPRSG